MELRDLIILIETEENKEIAVQKVKRELKKDINLLIAVDKCLYLFRPPMSSNSRKEFPNTWRRYEILCQALAEIEPKFAKSGEIILTTKNNRRFYL